MKLVGNIDLVKDGHISGWYADQDELASSLELSVEINGLACMQIKANKHRSDVKAVGIGSGDYGFNISVADNISFPGQYEINITAGSEKTPLPGMPIFINSAGQYSVDTGDLIAAQQPLPNGIFMSVTSPRSISRGETLDLISAAKKEGRQVVVLPPFIDWNIALFQRPQHIARAMAEAGVVVVYCTVGYHDTSDGFYELEPNLLWTNRFDEIESELHGVWFELYSTNPFPDADRLARWKKNGNKLLYEYVDHIDETISGSYTSRLYETFDSLNNDLIDLFVATAKNLYHELIDRFGNSKVVLSPNGVDVKHFTQEVEPAEDMRRILALGKPIVGYFGALARWLDYELMLGLALARPDLNFIYIGPEYDLDRDLPHASNIFWLGKVDYSELPKYGQYFDICFIPFKEGRIAETTSPLKLFEYFALQRPVVVTSWMAECVAFKEVLHGNTVEGLSKVLTAGLTLRKIEKSKQIFLQQALNNSWANRANVMIQGMNPRPNTAPAHITVKTNRNITVGSGNFDLPYKDVSATFIPNNKRGSILFGFGCNELVKGDYISLGIPVPSDIPVFSANLKITPPERNLETKSYAKYQIFANRKLVLECPITSSGVKSEVAIFSDLPIETLEIRIIAVKTTNAQWRAGEVWRLQVDPCSFSNHIRPSTTYVQCSDTHSNVIRKPSSVIV